MSKTAMHLKVLLPSKVLLDKTNVTHLVAETSEGSYGFLPNRLDCVAVLTPGILTFTHLDEGEVFVAVDEGVLVKTGLDVLISVRSALIGSDLETLRTAVEEEFLVLDQQAQQARRVMAKLESGFIHRFANFEKS